MNTQIHVEWFFHLNINFILKPPSNKNIKIDHSILQITGSITIICPNISPSNTRDSLPHLFLLDKFFVSILGTSLPPYWTSSFFTSKHLPSTNPPLSPYIISNHHFSQHSLWTTHTCIMLGFPQAHGIWEQDLWIYILNLLLRYFFGACKFGIHCSETNLGVMTKSAQPFPIHQFFVIHSVYELDAFVLEKLAFYYFSMLIITAYHNSVQSLW